MTTGSLQKTITLRHAIALYVSSVLGSGVLVLPGLAAQIAGPSSLIAWIVLSLASYPFAFTFGSLSARKPESGGIYAFAKESFGPHISSISAWLIALWYITGAPAVTMIASSYVSFAFPISREGLYIFSTLIILLAFIINYRGIRFSSNIQVVVVLSIVLMLSGAIVFSAGKVQAANFYPVFPHGILPVGTVAALIFWSYLGYENVSNVAEEFRNPERDFNRSILGSVLLIGLLYIAMAFVTVGTQAYKSGDSVAPFAAIFSNLFGRYGAVATSLIAVFIIFGTVNVYTAGMSRVIYAAARDGSFPRTLTHINEKNSVPDRSLIMLSGSSFIMLSVYYFLRVDLQTALLIPSGAAIIIYIVGSAAGIKLLPGKKGKALAWMSLIFSAAVLPFVGKLVAAGILVGLAGLIYSWAFRRKRIDKV
ncbi:MAG TPA: amino acid permease [Bacteroidales bacterium]|jgi:amino acid efflux transporter|nr:amino acid permease [Bacteroidales bacterium]